MNSVSYKEIVNKSNNFLEKNKDNDYTLINGSGIVLLSCPHSVFQTRKGKYKKPEIGALFVSIAVLNNTNCYLIAKTQNNGDDANFDSESTYKSKIKELISNGYIKYVLDLHCLDKKRKCDINLGTNFRRNIKTNKTAYKLLKNNLKSNGFKTKIDLPFNGNKKTIAGSLKNEFKNLWTIQIEINSSITTQSTTKFEKLIQILSDFINNINKKMSSKE